MFLLDTNACIRFLERRSERLREKFLSVPQSQKALCSVVAAELLFGAAKSTRKEETLATLLPFIQRYRLVDFDLNAAIISRRFVRSFKFKVGQLARMIFRLLPLLGRTR